MSQDSLDILDVAERVLTAALREVRNARARRPVDAPAPSKPKARKSQTVLCFDILMAAGRPLHVSVLLAELDKQGVRCSRESIVSALTKRLAPKGPFVRTGGNTFGLAAAEEAPDA